MTFAPEILVECINLLTVMLMHEIFKENRRTFGTGCGQTVSKNNPLSSTRRKIHYMSKIMFTPICGSSPDFCHNVGGMSA